MLGTEVNLRHQIFAAKLGRGECSVKVLSYLTTPDSASSAVLIPQVHTMEYWCQWPSSDSDRAVPVMVFEHYLFLTSYNDWLWKLHSRQLALACCRHYYLNLIFSFFVAVLCCRVGNIYRKMQLVALDWFWLHCRTFSAKERDDFKKGGLDWVTGSKKTVPAVTIYTGGFECQDGWHDSHDSWLMTCLSLSLSLWDFETWVFKSNSIRYTVSGIRLEVGSLAGVRLADRLLDWSSPV